MFLQVIPAEPPDSMLTFAWIVIGLLLAVIAYLYRTKESERKESTKTREEMLVKMLDALTEVSASLEGVASSIESWQAQFETMRAIEELAKGLKRYEKS